MYEAIADVDAAVHRLRELLPEPGGAVDERRAEAIGKAERELVSTWVRYLYAYDAVYGP